MAPSTRRVTEGGGLVPNRPIRIWNPKVAGMLPRGLLGWPRQFQPLRPETDHSLPADCVGFNRSSEVEEKRGLFRVEANPSVDPCQGLKYYDESVMRKEPLRTP